MSVKRIYLKSIGTPLEGSKFVVTVDKSVTIGRSRKLQNTVFIPGEDEDPNGDNYVSKQHCEVYFGNDGKFYVRNISNTNSTTIFVGGTSSIVSLKNDQAAPISVGDKIAIGRRTRFEVIIDSDEVLADLGLGDDTSTNSKVSGIGSCKNSTVLMPAMGAAVQPMMYNAGGYGTMSNTMQAMPYSTGQAQPYMSKQPMMYQQSMQPMAYGTQQPMMYGSQQPMGYGARPYMSMQPMGYGMPGYSTTPVSTPTKLSATTEQSAAVDNILADLDLDAGNNLDGVGTETVIDKDGNTQVIPNMETIVMPIFRPN